MKQRNIICTVLVLGLLTVSLSGCAATGMPDDTTQAPGNTTTVPVETDAAAQTTPNTDAAEVTLDTVPVTEIPDVTFATVPVTEIPDVTIATSPVIGGIVGTSESVPVSQQRLLEMRSGWSDAFHSDNGYFVVVESVNELTDALSQRGELESKVDLSEYDDAFFRDYRLVLIPRSSNSGSVQYEAVISAEDNAVEITLQGKVDGYGTGDMADWLVFVALPLENYPAGMTVTVTGSAGIPNSGVTS